MTDRVDEVDLIKVYNPALTIHDTPEEREALPVNGPLMRLENATVAQVDP
jgi:hypothetical protein